MKKRITGILMTLLLVCCLMFTMTACGDEDVISDSPDVETDSDAGTDDSDEAGTGEADDTDDSESVFPEALNDVEAIPIPDLSNTAWVLSGGMVDGQEMEEADVQAILDACGGCFNFIFGDDMSVTMENGEAYFNGTYTTESDDYLIDAVFENYEYYGVFTNIEDLTVMILVNKADSETALYMVPLEG